MRPAAFNVFLISLLIIGYVQRTFAEELVVTMAYRGPDKPSSFPGQLFLRVANESFMSIELVERMKSSQLFVDGKPFERNAVPFHGPAGLGPKSTWEGCIPLEDYTTAPLPAGLHYLQLHLGTALSKNLRVNAAPVIPPATTPAQRLHQVEALADILSPGMLRSCVENWLTEKDGGLQTLNPTHYYVSPDVKVLVSYEEAHPEPRVKGRVRLYNENQIPD